MLLGPINSIPHLADGELAVFTASGGQLGFYGKVTVRNDGTVTITKLAHGKPTTTKRLRLTEGERRQLFLEIDATDFDALHREPRAQNPPSAIDGLDHFLAVRRGGTARGWSDTLWYRPSGAFPLLDRLQALLSK